MRHVPLIALRTEPSAADEPQDRPPLPSIHAESATFFGWKDARLIEYLREGAGTSSGACVSVEAALKNPTVIRCVSLISFAIGMLPLHLRIIETKEKADEHPLFRVLHRRPNAWQTAFEFRTLMQQWALTHGDAYARIVRGGRRQVLALIPMDPMNTTPEQQSDWSIKYKYRRDGASEVTLDQQDVFHLRFGLSRDGIRGLSLVKQAAEAIGLALQTDRAAGRLFTNGLLAGGALKHPGKLSAEAYDRLKASMEAREGADMAHKWLITEEGMEAQAFSATGRDSQHLESRKHGIEDIARPFGVPRPLLGIDETSWGSGIDALGQFFVRYGLAPWFESWEQAISRDLLTEAEADTYEAKFNPGGLLRGSLAQQGDFFSKGLGAGGHHPFLEVQEVRDWLDLPESNDLPPPAGAAAAQPPAGGPNGGKNDPASAPAN